MNNVVLINDLPQELTRNFTIKAGEDQTFIFFQEPEEDFVRKIKFKFTIKNNSKLHLWHIFFGSNDTNFEETVHFDEENGFAENHTIYFGDLTKHLSMNISHVHDAPSGTSRIFSRGILKDTAKGRYDGNIKISQQAKKTDAFLEEKTLLLSSGAKSEAIPALEIGTNDVKAAHSASCTRVDDNQLFYAASRGIPQEEAIRLIAEGFLGSLLMKLPDEKLQKHVFETIRKKL